MKPTNLTILVTDESATIRRMTSRVIQQLGHRPLVAENGDRGIEMAFAMLPDVVCLSADLAVASGHEVAGRLKGDPRTSRIPLILLVEEEPVSFENDSFEGVLEKPVAKGRLEQVLTEIFGGVGIFDLLPSSKMLENGLNMLAGHLGLSVRVKDSSGKDIFKRDGGAGGWCGRYYPWPNCRDIGGLVCNAPEDDQLDMAEPHIALLLEAVGRELQLSRELSEITDDMLRLSGQFRLVQTVARKINGVSRLEEGYRVALDEISSALSADQAFVRTEELCVTCNMLQEEVDEFIPDSDLIHTRGDGSSLLVAPVNGNKHPRNGHAVFVRRNGRPPFTVPEGQFLGLVESIISPAFDALHLYENQQGLYRNTIASLAAAIDAKDRHTLGHSNRVAQYAMAIGRRLGLAEQQLHDLEIAAIMHDLGKIGVSEVILGKPTSLNDDEISIIRLHPDFTSKILQPIQLPDHILLGAIQHHERLDGSGYPFGLAGDQITLFGRIIAVADVFDAITSDRPYRRAMPLETALNLLHQGSDSHFDSRVIRALMEHLLAEKIFIPPSPPQAAFVSTGGQQ